jgi:NADPH2:quinone reductase
MVTRIVAESYGGPEVLKLTETGAVPQPGPGEVTLEPRAIGVNPVDYKLYSGMFGKDPDALPLPVGLEAAGVVTAVGDDASGRGGPVSVGDEVIVHPVGGAYATRLNVPAENVVPKPAGLSWESAAGLLLAGGTAVHGLAVIGLREGDTVLVHGASGGVGQLAVQLAVAAGAKVLGTAGSDPERQRLVAGYGATPLPYGPGLAGRVREAAPEGVRSALDTVGADEAVDVSLEVVPDPQRIVSTAAFGRAEDGIKLIGSGPNADPGTVIRAGAWKQLVPLAERGALTVRVARTFPLAEAAEAHRFLAEGHPGGKVVLIP